MTENITQISKSDQSDAEFKLRNAMQCIKLAHERFTSHWATHGLYDNDKIKFFELIDAASKFLNEVHETMKKYR
ncbi:hypothetical protein HYW20_02460 [Candidatus Woesearchaeota archaeon]|nr:hypothetical protein [Candidatus Woesearchaeota archaeon]